MEGNGKAQAGAVFGQMIDKRPQHVDYWVPPVRSTDKNDDPVLLSLRKVTLAVVPKAGVGPRGYRSYYARVGRFSDSEANGAFAAFMRLGVFYLNAQMPPWLRRLLYSCLFAPPTKNPPAPGGENRRATHQGRNIDTSPWCKAFQTDQTPKRQPREPVSQGRHISSSRSREW